MIFLKCTAVFTAALCRIAKTQKQRRPSQVALALKNPPAKEADIRDVGSIPGSGKSIEESMATHSSMLARRIPWTEEPAGLLSIG